MKTALKLWGLWRSIHMPKSWKKLTASALAGLILLVGPQVGIPEDTCKWLSGVISAWVLAQGAADAGKTAEQMRMKVSGQDKLL